MIFEVTLREWRWPLRLDPRIVELPAYREQMRRTAGGRPLYAGHVLLYPLIALLDAEHAPSYVVVGETSPGVVRFHMLPERSAARRIGARRERLPADNALALLGVRRFTRMIAEWLRVEEMREPACVEHDDCAAEEEIGVSCWARSHPSAASETRVSESLTSGSIPRS